VTSRLHIVPVGISLLDSIADEWPPDLRDALRSRDLWDDLATATGAGAGTAVPDTVLGADGYPVDQVRARLRDLPVEACAEWQALDRYNDEFGRAGQDTWVFAGSDTENGSRAGLLAALGHAHRQPDVPLHYLSTPGPAAHSLLAPGAAYLTRLPGLDLASPGATPVPQTTWQAMGDLGGLVVLSVAQATGRPYEVVFHLSGGYKAMLPYFLTMAQAVRTELISRPTTKVAAYCLHESSRRPVPLPVPYFTGVIAEWIGELARVSSSGEFEVDEKVADGLAGLYLEDEVRHGKRRFTPAGIIIARALWALHSKP
jgi:hypothetical protein